MPAEQFPTDLPYVDRDVPAVLLCRAADEVSAMMKTMTAPSATTSLAPVPVELPEEQRVGPAPAPANEGTDPSDMSDAELDAALLAAAAGIEFRVCDAARCAAAADSTTKIDALRHEAAASMAAASAAMAQESKTMLANVAKINAARCVAQCRSAGKAYAARAKTAELEAKAAIVAQSVLRARVTQ